MYGLSVKLISLCPYMPKYPTHIFDPKQHNLKIFKRRYKGVSDKAGSAQMPQLPQMSHKSQMRRPSKSKNLEGLQRLKPIQDIRTRIM